MIPEYLNIIGASLYLWSASLYNDTITDWTYEGASTLKVHKIELASSLIEVFAAFGWAIVWAFTYLPRKGRGWTLDDPDFYGNFFIVAPSIMYFVYNIQNLINPSSYNTNTLYKQADWLYFVGALFYMCSALRDDGWFESFPLWNPCTVTCLRLCGLGPAVEGCAERCYGSEQGKPGGAIEANARPFLDEDEEAAPIFVTGVGKAKSGGGVFSSTRVAWTN